MPNATAQISTPGLLSSTANAIAPPTSISQIPHTRWCRCTPPSTTLPGHHGTFGLRDSRALVRMKANDARNATKTRKSGPTPRAYLPASLQITLSAYGCLQIGSPGHRASGRTVDHVQRSLENLE